jgi:gluconokinase
MPATPLSEPGSAAPGRQPAARPIVVMGVSGAGKSSVGAALAELLETPFVDADTLHPLTNVEKMMAGVPLTDEDRWPWLDRVGAELAATTEAGLVMACSALRRAYRDAIRTRSPQTVFVLLDADGPLRHERLTQRPGHFMPASLLRSQLETLGPLEADEAGLTVKSMEGVQATAAAIRDRLKDVRN